VRGGVGATPTPYMPMNGVGGISQGEGCQHPINTFYAPVCQCQDGVLWLGDLRLLGNQ
jgi:hypothetical protein